MFSGALDLLWYINKGASAPHPARWKINLRPPGSCAQIRWHLTTLAAHPELNCVDRWGGTASTQANSVAPGSSTSAVYGQVGELYRAVPTRLQRADSVLPNARCSTATLCRYSMRVLVPRQLKWRIACAECASTAGRWGVCAGPHRPSQAGVVPCMQLPCGTQGPD